jgi:hypothetical protein
MSMMGELTFFLSIQVKQTKQGTFVHQAKYTNDLMKKFKMVELKPVSTSMSSAVSLGPDEDGDAVDQREYRSMIGSLLYLTATRPDIQFIVGLCARFLSSPRSSHQTAVQRVFRYLKHTLEFGIWYSASSSLDLVGFSDADFTSCGIDRKSISGTCHFFRSSVVCWSSQKQSSVAQSTTETEYVAAASCCSQILWIVHTMRDFGVSFERVPLRCDNTSAISVAKNPVFHKKMRHVERRHHFLRDHIEKGNIEMSYIDTERQLTDIFTKPLDSSRFANLRGRGENWCLPSIWLGLRGSWCFCLVYYVFSFSLAFSLYSPKSPCFTCYTSLCLLNYAYHCARMSSNEM